MFSDYLNKIAEKESLSREEAADALQTIIDDKVSGTEIGAFLMGLRIKGEATDELLGFLDTMENNMVKIEVKDKNAVDVCGTGGDSKHSFNVSTAASIIVAAGGVTVASMATAPYPVNPGLPMYWKNSELKSTLHRVNQNAASMKQASAFFLLPSTIRQ